MISSNDSLSNYPSFPWDFLYPRLQSLLCSIIPTRDGDRPRGYALG